MLRYSNDITIDSYLIEHTASLNFKNLPLFLISFGRYYTQSSYFIERDGTDSFLMMYTLSGKGIIDYRGVKTELTPHTAVIIDCNEYHYYKVAADTWNIFWIHFNGPSARTFFEMINGDAFTIVKLGESNNVVSSFDDIEKSIKNSHSLPDVRISLYLQAILTEMALNKVGPLNNDNYSQHKADIDRALKYIHGHYSDDISIDDISRNAIISKYYFSRLFKSYMGQSPYEYLITYRISKAKQLLVETDINIHDISVQVGFSDVNNFIRYFKRLAGTTPNKYRINYKK